ncbi:hypothetical protein BJ170DRAFT_427469 [Xylariales sp. AK1849]|nr:hypothetical protein BJ170DRAFT_427469 [Xylariales sp. AK1849]
MVYAWDTHEQTCYRMYIDEKRSLEEIMEFMRTEHKFAPSKRAFQTQFRRWDFPSKQNPAHKNDRLVDRVKELWEKNLSQREMLRILNEEDGFDIKQRQLMRVRTRNRWLLRMPNPEKLSIGSETHPPIDDTVESVLESQLLLGLELHGASPSPIQQSRGVAEAENGLSPQVIAKRRARLQKLESQSAERWETKKRRRRTRGWAGLPADPPGPPRFPSETTIDESRDILGLSTQLYREIRTRFARICHGAGVSKKTIAGPERWEGVKNLLIQQLPHLQSVMWMKKENMDNKKLALDVICTDVTKRMRTMEQKMTIAEAKNALGINPEESRTIRQEFLTLLKDDHFISKVEAGQEHWEELKRKWMASSATLQGILGAGATGSTHEAKSKGMDVLARDVMKRHRDDQTKRDPNRTRSVPAVEAEVQPSSRLSTGRNLSQQSEVDISNTAVMDNDQHLPVEDYSQPQQLTQYHHIPTPMVPGTPISHNGQVGHGHLQLQPEHLRSPDHAMQHDRGLQDGLSSSVLNNGLPIDSQVDNSMPVPMNGHESAMAAQHTTPSYLPQDLSSDLSQSQAHSYVQNHFAAQPTPPPPIAVYLRLHPSSIITMAASIWIATLTARTFEELRQVAVKDLAGTVCGRVEGILGEGMRIEISRDDELTAYLAVVEGRDGAGSQGAPGFYIQVLAASWKT